MIFRMSTVALLMVLLTSRAVVTPEGCHPVCPAGQDPQKNSPYQHLLLRDDFDGWQPDDPCYTMAPRCSVRLDWFAPGTCPEDQNYDSLKDLNKCIWTVFTGYDFWRSAQTEGGTAYRAENVAVEAGELVLKATRNPHYDPAGGVCGIARPNDPLAPDYYGTNCKYALGGVMSRYVDDMTQGMNARYGRIDIRAKIETKTGGYGALWMWPEQLGQGYPNIAATQYLYKNSNGDMVPYFLGEIDIWENNSADSQKEGIQTYHCWYADAQGSSFTPTKVYLDLNEYHHFGVEWQEDSITFYVDSCYTQKIENGDKASAGGQRKLTISDIASFLILNIYLTAAIPAESVESLRIDQVSIYDQ
jgi:hypothetical protein